MSYGQNGGSDPWTSTTDPASSDQQLNSQPSFVPGGGQMDPNAGATGNYGTQSHSVWDWLTQWDPAKWWNTGTGFADNVTSGGGGGGLFGENGSSLAGTLVMAGIILVLVLVSLHAIEKVA